MIITSSQPMEIGRIYSNGDDGLLGLVDGNLELQREFRLMVMRQATFAEWQAYWRSEGKEPADWVPDEYFYLVSMD